MTSPDWVGAVMQGKYWTLVCTCIKIEYQGRCFEYGDEGTIEKRACLEWTRLSYGICSCFLSYDLRIGRATFPTVHTVIVNFSLGKRHGWYAASALAAYEGCLLRE